MAKVLGPLHSDQASGSVGSITYSQAPGGTNVRARISPVNKKTQTRGEYRRLGMAYTAFQYQNKNPIFNEDWKQKSQKNTVQNSLGQTQRMSDFAWYQKFGIVCYYYFNGILSNPPMINIIEFLPRINVEWTASGALLSWDTEIFPGQAIIVRQWRNLQVTQTRNQRWVFSNQIMWPAVSPMLITPEAGGGSGPYPLPSIILNTYQEFLVYTIDQGGLKSPYLRFRVQADS